MPSVPLHNVLAHAIDALWPRRRQQELLLDLGERKRWGASERLQALQRASQWLVDELRLDGDVRVGSEAPVALDALEPLGRRLLQEQSRPGVARWVQGLAPAVGSAPKTLANSLSAGLDAKRTDHRWLAAIARCQEPAAVSADAWLYHRRSPASVQGALSRMAGRALLDAGDALLLLSLLALWQRRRPTTRTRSNQGRARSRRETPKPVAALAGALASPGQLDHLFRVAAALPDPQPLQLLALEAALTEAHLAPHRARRSAQAELSDGEVWLRAVERAIAALPAQGVRGAFAFRIERMRAWRDRRPLSLDPEPPDTAYVRASLALARRAPQPTERFRTREPGLLMLLPQLRSSNIEVQP